MSCGTQLLGMAPLLPKPPGFPACPHLLTQIQWNLAGAWSVVKTKHNTLPENSHILEDPWPLSAPAKGPCEPAACCLSHPGSTLPRSMAMSLLPAHSPSSAALCTAGLEQAVILPPTNASTAETSPLKRIKQLSFVVSVFWLPHFWCALSLDDIMQCLQYPCGMVSSLYMLIFLKFHACYINHS